MALKQRKEGLVMNLYAHYLKLWKQGLVGKGFSSRLPDYATQAWFDYFQKALSSQRKGAFLDIGAGDGRLSLVLLTSGYQQGTALEVCVDRNAWTYILSNYPKFFLYEATLQEVMTRLEHAFEAVIVAEVFEHIPSADVHAFLCQLSRVVVPGGVVFLTTPNSHVQGPAQKSLLWHERYAYGHYYHYTKQELEKLFDQAGFDVEACNFECHRLKKILYDRCFYPISRWDERLSHSKRLPCWFKHAYRCVSWPFIVLTRLYFKALAYGLLLIERYRSGEQTAATIIITARKRST